MVRPYNLLNYLYLSVTRTYGNKKLCLELYNIFRNEYDKRIDDYLCGKGITNKIDWFDNNYFDEPNILNIGDKKCKKK